MSQGLEDVIKVLFVDDEPNILSSLRRGLIQEPFVKFFANTGEEALRILSAHEIAVIVTDMKMPVMNGLDLLKIVADKYPDVVKIVLSGYNQLPQVLATINTIDIYKYIVKPWDMENDFIPVLRSAIEQYQMKKAFSEFNQVLEKKNEFYQKMIKVSDERFLKLKSEQIETHVYSVESLKLFHDIAKALLLNRESEEEFERISKLFLKVMPIFYGKFPTDSFKYGIDKTVAVAGPILHAWYELIASKSKQEVKHPHVKLGALESLRHNIHWGPKDFELFLKLVLFDLSLLHLTEDQEPFCELHGFYHEEQGKVVIELQTHLLTNLYAQLLKNQFVLCYSKILELNDGEFVYYAKSGREHYLITLPTVE